MSAATDCLHQIRDPFSCQERHSLQGIDPFISKYVVGCLIAKAKSSHHRTKGLSVCGSGLRDPIAYSLLGGDVPYPEHRLNWYLDSVPIFRFLCFPSVMAWSLTLPPSKIHPGSLISRTSCPSPFSFCPICLLSARFCVFSRPPPVSGPPIVRPPSSVRRKTTNPPAIG